MPTFTPDGITLASHAAGPEGSVPIVLPHGPTGARSILADIGA
jgi:hypothetical protein